MLKEIRCDKFKDGQTPRPPITFRQGLNVVLGGGRAQNSIGKSTFLMIIDFAFGGRDYIRLSDDVTKNVGIHAIQFEFEFDGNSYYFSRSTEEPSRVVECDKNYAPQKAMELDEFTDFLALKYGTDATGSSFRDVVSGYFRIYGRHNYNEKQPLIAFQNDKQEEGIRRLLQLYQLYAPIEELKGILKTEKEKLTTYKNARKYEYVVGVTKKSDYKENQDYIEVLQRQKDELVAQNAKGLIELDWIQAERLSEKRKQIRTLQLAEQNLRFQLDSIKADRDPNAFRMYKDFDELLEFFPNADIKHLEDIERFHYKLSAALKAEYDSKERDLRARLRMLYYCLKMAEATAGEIKETKDVSLATLERYSELDREIVNRQKANEYFDETNRLKDTVKDAQARVNDAIQKTVSELQNEINAELNRLNSIVCEGRNTAPFITIEGVNKYTFEIPNDNGAGSFSRGMFLFDIVSLERTVLPAIIHDSFNIKQVEDAVMVRIMEQYELMRNFGKQVFIAIDKGDTYTETGSMPDILKDTIVLRLSPGHELFGWPWNKPEEKEATNQLIEED